ncbi:MAG: phosphatase PAP2 family protein, partial [Methylococcales bacterium]
YRLEQHRARCGSAHAREPAARAFAMMHIAIFDAVNGIEAHREPYHVARKAPSGALPEAAVATAAYEVLSALYPKLNPVLKEPYQKSLGHLPEGQAKSRGQEYGRYVAKRILKLRSRDGANTKVSYSPPAGAAHWQPTAPAFGSGLLPVWEVLKPFAMKSPSQFRAPAPPALNSPEYVKAFNEVRAYGGVNSTERTAEQTLVAYFWEDGPGTVTPPGHWQIIAQQISKQRGLSMPENARLFGLLSLVQADAAVASWETKYHWNYVRPVTAIARETGDDGNPETTPDPSWVNLIPWPPFPAYTSGHSTFSGGSARLLARFFGSDASAFCGESPDPRRWPALSGVKRCWDSFSQAVEEAGQSRIYGGIHWQFDNQAGLTAGRALADYVFENTLRDPRGK